MDKHNMEPKEAVGAAAGQRVNLLQSEIKVRDQIATLKHRMEMKFLKLEEQAVCDLRALRGQEMLDIKRREDRVMARDFEGEQDVRSKTLSFDPNPVLEQLESISDLGTVKLVDATYEVTEEIDATIDSSELYGDTSTVHGSVQAHHDGHLLSNSGNISPSATSESSTFLCVGGQIKPITNEKLSVSVSSSYCFVETGTLSRRFKQRSSILDKSDVYGLGKLPEIDSKSTQRMRNDPARPEMATSPPDGDIVFTVLKDSRIVTVSKSSGSVSLYSPDFVLLKQIQVPAPLAISHHVAYDVIAIVCREDSTFFVNLLKASKSDLVHCHRLDIQCPGHISCITYSASKLYLGCSCNHIHVFDENWVENKKLVHTSIGQTMVAIATNEKVFSLVGNDGSVTYIDSRGRYLSKDSIDAIAVGYMFDKPFVLCNDNGIKVVETSSTEEETSGLRVVIKTGLSQAYDMHISAAKEVVILYWNENENNLDITKFKP